MLPFFLIFLRLGLTSFGGPVAHLAYFREEFVTRRALLSEEAFAEIVALCQSLPGPTSSQVAFAIALRQGGWGAGLLAWLAFTLPSALIMFALAFTGVLAAGTDRLMHGLKIVAVVIVAEALRGMAKTLCPDKTRATVASAVLILLLLWPSPYSHLLAIALAAIAGTLLLKSPEDHAPSENASALVPFKIPLRAYIAGGIYLAILLALPLFAQGPIPAQLFAVFYQAGTLVFGGGHVVLPLLQSQLVPTYMDNDFFLSGYAAAQALPGPLFSIGAYLGGFAGLIGLFLPGMLLLIAIAPFWQILSRKASFANAIKGINAAVVGLLLAAFYNPIWITAIRHPLDFAAASVGWLLLAVWKLPSWLIVGLGLIYSLI